MSNNSLIPSNNNGHPPLPVEYDPYSLPPEYAYPVAPAKHLRDYWHVVMRRKWIVLACLVGAVSAAAFWTTRQTPLYQATAKLEIDQQSDNVLPYQMMTQDVNSYMY